jgi:plastocyanin
MRTLRSLPAILTVLALAACTAAKPGWTYAPAPSATPIPSVAASGSAPAPSGSAPAPSATASASAGASSGAGTVLELEAENIAYDTAELKAPAAQPFQIDFKNKEAGVLHNVEIKDASGASLFKGEIITGVAERVYDVAALPAGAYTFVCSVHPVMTGTLRAE